MTEIDGSISGSRLYDKCLGALVGGVIGDALGAPSEGKSPDEIDARFGWLDDFDSGGTDDTILRDILARTLIRTSGYATIDDWADDWMAAWDEIFGPKQQRFFLSVLHTARRLRVQGEPRLAALGNIPCSSSAMCMAPAGLVNACNPAQAAAQATHLASLINVQDAGFCQDGAAIVAAAVAAACRTDASVDSILQEAVASVPATSGARMLAGVEQALDAARDRDYAAFRAYVHEHKERFFQPRKANSLETVPLTPGAVLACRRRRGTLRDLRRQPRRRHRHHGRHGRRDRRGVRRRRRDQGGLGRQGETQRGPGPGGARARPGTRGRRQDGARTRRRRRLERPAVMIEYS